MNHEHRTDMVLAIDQRAIEGAMDQGTSDRYRKQLKARWIKCLRWIKGPLMKRWMM